MTNVQAILLGLSFGMSAGFVTATYLFLTRAARRARNRTVIASGYFLVGGSALTSLVLLLNIGDRLGMGRHSAQHYSSLYAFMVACAALTFVGVRAEFKWRKSVGI